MTVVLSSMFRDSVPGMRAYFERIDKLRAEMDVRLVLAEGDSIDGSFQELSAYLTPRDLLLKVDHGGRKYGSIDEPERWENIGIVMREIVAEIDDPGSAFVYVEQDLIWSAETMWGLLRDLDKVEVVAPQVRALDAYNNTDRFYDIWGFRKDGAEFNPYPPYWHGEADDNGLVKIDSCGSCFVVRADAFDIVRAWDGIWPFPGGGRLWMDPQLRIHHP